MIRNLFAYTGPGFDPEFVSVNEVNGVIEVSVRGAKPESGPAPQAMARIPDADWALLKAPTDEQIKHMVERFLRWRLPEDFHPDGGISFEKSGSAGTPYEHRREPVGTNLL